ncbi:transcriptional regulator, y4mF family [Roseibium album]|nr:transcriptional regulator, y4mF family [Roseibium album]
MNTPCPAFGKSLKSLRRERGFSQVELASRLGSTQRHVSFLETGRARPSRYMIQRVERELALPIGRAQVLYETAGFASPYSCLAEDSPDVLDALNLIENRLLANWPFPAFVLDKRWTILRMNVPAKLFLSDFTDGRNEPANLFRIFTSATFRERVLNWEEAAPIFAARLFKQAADDPEMADILEQVRESGFLDGLDEVYREETPIFVPVELLGPDGTRLRLTSLLGQLASVQDAVIEGMTIELMVPMDKVTENMLFAFGELANSKYAAE